MIHAGGALRRLNACKKGKNGLDIIPHQQKWPLQEVMTKAMTLTAQTPCRKLALTTYYERAEVLKHQICMG